MKENFNLKKFEEKYGKVYGRNSKNARIYKHSGNWARKPLNFFSANAKRAVATALEIEANLCVWNEESSEWDVVLDIDWLYEEHDDEDAAELIKIGLDKIGLKRRDISSGKEYEWAYRGYEMEDIPKGAHYLANGIFFN